MNFQYFRRRKKNRLTIMLLQQKKKNIYQIASSNVTTIFKFLEYISMIFQFKYCFFCRVSQFVPDDLSEHTNGRSRKRLPINSDQLRLIFQSSFGMHMISKSKCVFCRKLIALLCYSAAIQRFDDVYNISKTY